MPHLYPELVFFLVVSVVPVAVLLHAGKFVEVTASGKSIAFGCLLLSLSCVADFGLRVFIDSQGAVSGYISPQHILLILFGFIPGAGMVGFGFASWAREVSAIRAETSRREALEAELMTVQAQLKQEVARAEAADKIKSNFLANMSHDLRTPLNAIMGFSEMMHAETFGKLGTERYKEYLAAINTSSKQLHDNISDMLDMSKIHTGQMQLSRTDVSLRHLANDCIDMLRPDVEAKRITLDLNFAADLTVYADSRMLLHVLLNLLRSAVKHTPEYGKVSLVVLQQTDGKPVIIVRDTGRGMSPKDIELATTPFQATESLVARSHEWLALQLALANQFIELHDGQFMIDSRRDFGTCVTIKLPAIDVADVTYGASNVVSIV